MSIKVAQNKGVALHKHHKHHEYPGKNNTLNSLLVTLKVFEDSDFLVQAYWDKGPPRC